MLSIASISAGGASGAASYYENLAKEDYYENGMEPPGQWAGSLSKEMGLEGKVQNGDLSKSFQGVNPRTGEMLANNAGPEHKPGYDLTFSAPKSVSVVWATGTDEQRRDISAAHKEAVEKALKLSESNGAFRQRYGQGGYIKADYTGGVSAALFEHSSNRNLEPHLHTHAVVMNISDNGKTMDFDARFTKELGAAYRTELSKSLSEMGYKVEGDKFSFKISDVPKGLEEELSTRRQEIVAALDKKGLDSAKSAEIATLNTRQDKQHIDRNELFTNAREAADRYGLDSTTLQQAENKEFTQEWSEDKFLDNAFEKASTLSDTQLRAKGFEEGQAKNLGIDEVLDRLEAARKEGTLIELKDKQTGEIRYTSAEVLERERAITDRAYKMHMDFSHKGISKDSLNEVFEGRTLTDEQKEAVKHITEDGRMAVVEGSAGTGKSYMLDAAREAWEKNSYNVRGCALSGKAADELQQSSGIKSETIHGTIRDIDRGDIVIDKDSVFVMDEAGMTDSKTFEKLQTRIEQGGGKLVIIGDTKQLQPIDAGGPMRAIRDKIGYAQMSDIRRQATEAERQIVKDFKDGRGDKAFERLDSMGRVKEFDTVDKAHKEAMNEVVKDLKENKSSIAIANTNKELDSLNKYAREAAREKGLVTGKDYAFKTEYGEKQFAKGDRVVFLQNSKESNVKNGTTGTIVKAADGKITVSIDGRKGENVTIQQQQYDKVKHAYAITGHKSQGVTVDKAHLIANERADKHWAYVGASRHKESVHVYGTKESLKEFQRLSTRDQTKDFSADKKYEERKNEERDKKTQSELTRRDKETDKQRGEKLEKTLEQTKAKQQNPRMEPHKLKEEVNKAAQLAEKSLQNKEKMPNWNQVHKDVKNGKAEIHRHAKHTFVEYKGKDGKTEKVFNPTLHGQRARETKVLGLKAKVVDRKILSIRNPLTNKRIGGIKVGTKVVIQKNSMGQRALNAVTKDGGKFERYRNAKSLEAGAVRGKIAVENALAKHSTKSELQKLVNDAKQQQGKGTEKTASKANNKDKTELNKANDNKAKTGLKDNDKAKSGLSEATEKHSAKSDLQKMIDNSKEASKTVEKAVDKDIEKALGKDNDKGHSR